MTQAPPRSKHNLKVKKQLDSDPPLWKYLEARPTSWKKQLFLKGRRVTAANIWLDMLTNSRSVRDEAANWDLSVEIVEEIVRYCEANRDLITKESEHERLFMKREGIPLTLEDRLCA